MSRPSKLSILAAIAASFALPKTSSTKGGERIPPEAEACGVKPKAQTPKQKRKARKNARARRRKAERVRQEQAQAERAEKAYREGPTVVGLSQDYLDGRDVCCTICNRPAQKVHGDEVYPRRPDLHELIFWVCDPCDARVGTHKGSEAPLGVFANKVARAARQEAHKYFDLVWQDTSPIAIMSKSEAYNWLTQIFDSEHMQHFGIAYLNPDQCQHLMVKVGELLGQDPETLADLVAPPNF